MDEQINGVVETIQQLEKENAELKLRLDAVSGCCSSSEKISKVYLIDPNDCVFENGVMVRMKRRYGKYKRVIHVIDYNNR